MISEAAKGPARIEIDKLQSIVAKFKRDNDALRQRVAELEGSEHWIPLKSADRGPHSYNTARRWAADGDIKSRHVGGRVYVEVNDLARFMARRSGS